MQKSPSYNELYEDKAKKLILLLLKYNKKAENAKQDLKIIRKNIAKKNDDKNYITDYIEELSDMVKEVYEKENTEEEDKLQKHFIEHFTHDDCIGSLLDHVSDIANNPIQAYINHLAQGVAQNLCKIDSSLAKQIYETLHNREIKMNDIQEVHWQYYIYNKLLDRYNIKDIKRKDYGYLKGLFDYHREKGYQIQDETGRKITAQVFADQLIQKEIPSVINNDENKTMAMMLVERKFNPSTKLEFIRSRKECVGIYDECNNGDEDYDPSYVKIDNESDKHNLYHKLVNDALTVGLNEILGDLPSDMVQEARKNEYIYQVNPKLVFDKFAVTDRGQLDKMYDYENNKLALDKDAMHSGIANCYPLFFDADYCKKNKDEINACKKSAQEQIIFVNKYFTQATTNRQDALDYLDKVFSKSNNSDIIKIHQMYQAMNKSDKEQAFNLSVFVALCDAAEIDRPNMDTRTELGQRLNELHEKQKPMIKIIPHAIRSLLGQDAETISYKIGEETHDFRMINNKLSTSINGGGPKPSFPGEILQLLDGLACDYDERKKIYNWLKRKENLDYLVGKRIITLYNNKYYWKDSYGSYEMFLDGTRGVSIIDSIVGLDNITTFVKAMQDAKVEKDREKPQPQPQPQYEAGKTQLIPKIHQTAKDIYSTLKNAVKNTRLKDDQYELQLESDYSLVCNDKGATLKHRGRVIDLAKEWKTDGKKENVMLNFFLKKAKEGLQRALDAAQEFKQEQQQQKSKLSGKYTEHTAIMQGCKLYQIDSEAKSAITIRSDKKNNKSWQHEQIIEKLSDILAEAFHKTRTKFIQHQAKKHMTTENLNPYKNMDSDSMTKTIESCISFAQQYGGVGNSSIEQWNEFARNSQINVKQAGLQEMFVFCKELSYQYQEIAKENNFLTGRTEDVKIPMVGKRLCRIPADYTKDIVEKAMKLVKQNDNKKNF